MASERIIDTLSAVADIIEVLRGSGKEHVERAIKPHQTEVARQTEVDKIRQLCDEAIKSSPDEVIKKLKQIVDLTSCSRCKRAITTIINMAKDNKDIKAAIVTFKDKLLPSYYTILENEKILEGAQEKECALCERAKNILCADDEHCRKLIERAFIDDDKDAQAELAQKGLLRQAVDIILG
jgi:hypothetical protein